MLSRKVLDQITRFNRKDLGNIKTPAPLGLVFKESSLVSPLTNNTLQWVKRSYILDRNNLDILTRDYFNDTEKLISYSVLSPTVDGSLSDSNLLPFTNAEYAIEVYTEIKKSYQFRVSCNLGSILSIYTKRQTGDSYEIGTISEGFTGGSINMNFNANEWVTILIYYYTPVLGYILGFSPLVQVANSWRIPDISPPPVPEWDTIALTTSGNSLTGVVENVLHWKVPSSKDWNGNGIYYHETQTTTYNVLEQNPDSSLNAFFLDSGTSTALAAFPSGSSIYL